MRTENITFCGEVVQPFEISIRENLVKGSQLKQSIRLEINTCITSRTTGFVLQRIYYNLLLICIFKWFASRNRSIFTSHYRCASTQSAKVSARNYLLEDGIRIKQKKLFQQFITWQYHLAICLKEQFLQYHLHYVQ